MFIIIRLYVLPNFRLLKNFNFEKAQSFYKKTGKFLMCKNLNPKVKVNVSISNGTIVRSSANYINNV